VGRLLRRIKRLADPLENPYGWAQVFGAIAVAMGYATIALPQKDDHPYLFASHLAGFLTALVLTVFFIWIGWRRKQVRPETVESIVGDMEKHRDAKAPGA
jgi:hypothetical protein